MKKTFVIYSILLFSLCLNIYLIFVQSTQEWLGDIIKNSPDIIQPSTYTKKHSTITPAIKPSVTSESIEQSISPIKKIEVAINAFDYDEAIHLMQVLSPIENEQVKAYWLSHSKALISRNELSDAQYSIKAYLDHALNDVDFHYLYVEVLVEQALIQEAIEYAYTVQYYLYELPVKDKSIDDARALAHLEIEKYLDLEDWLSLSRFCEQVIPFDPAYMAYYWFLAQAEFKQGLYESALQNIEPLLVGTNFSVQAATLKKQIEQMLLAPTEIPLIKQGEHFIVKGYINESTSVNLLLDTGASISLLSQEIFDNLSQYHEMEYVKTLYLNTAGGIVEANLYQVTLFAIDEFEVENMQFTVSPSFSSEYDGLLGMNFLSLFKFSINQNRQTLSLEKE